MNLNLIPAELQEFYDFDEWRNAMAVLTAAYPAEWADIIDILSKFRLLRTDLGEAGEKGGGKSKIAIRMDRMFRAKGWAPREFATSIMVDDVKMESPTHEVDCFKSKVALELEWNNKTEFYDRDLNNFRLLFDLRVSDVGIIITRCDELQDVFNRLGRGTSYGSTTTVLSKLQRKLKGGAGGGCPILAIGMRKSLYVDDVTDPSLGAGFEAIERVTKPKRKIPLSKITAVDL
ncbi:MAG: BglII/BstYI family type II restriction endonuclease [Alphaproteobacteria bacterium]|nr:BglII/BstYI family type II restriction endonuclease [Alphaproteobacteria bacterium]